MCHTKNNPLHSKNAAMHPIKEIISPTSSCSTSSATSDKYHSATEYSKIMKFLLVATFLLVACIFTPSWAAPLREEDEARAVLRAIRLLLASENYGHSELQQSGNATSAPSGKPQVLHMNTGLLTYQIRRTV